MCDDNRSIDGWFHQRAHFPKTSHQIYWRSVFHHAYYMTLTCNSLNLTKRRGRLQNFDGKLNSYWNTWLYISAPTQANLTLSTPN
jgi:hypothetical protein